MNKQKAEQSVEPVVSLKKNTILCLCIIMILFSGLTLSGCVSEKNQKKSEINDVKKESPQPINLLEDSERMRYKKNEIEEVPDGYVSPCKNSGTIETLEYPAKDYTGSDKVCNKCAKVYLPYGYDDEKAYPVFYLMHGSGDDESWYFEGTNNPSDSFLGSLLDHMIAGGELEPCIVCTPTYKNEYCQEDSTCTEIFYEELVNDLIPALEGKYATAYRQLCRENEGADEQDSFVQEAEEKTRLCRAFGGFSMGALTTWNVFQHSLKEVGFFIPVSGEDWGVSGSEKQAEVMVSSVKEQQISPEEFRFS